MGHPADQIAAACARWGAAEVAARCADLLTGTAADDPDLLAYLSGDGPAAYRTGRARWSGADGGYWRRVWAARGLLHAWPGDDPTDAVVAALADPHWRVREMAAKVVAAHEVGPAGDALVPLLGDETPRVRAAAARALGLVGEAEHALPLRRLRDDPEVAVADQADRALRRLSARLDRELP